MRVRRGVCARRQVKIFKEGKLKQLMHPAEIWALARYKARGGLRSYVKTEDEHVSFCNEAIGKVSRSFTAVS